MDRKEPMDFKAYFDSGTLEAYCLGQLLPEEAGEVARLAGRYAEIRDEILAIEAALQFYAGVPLKPALKQSILRTLSELPPAEAMDLNHLPRLHRYSHYQAWNETLAAMQPGRADEGMHIRVLKKEPGYQLCVAWLYQELTEDGHDDRNFHESFLILEGSCVCNLGGGDIHLQAGDFLDIPANTRHTIRTTSPNLGYVKALIQREQAG